ncbi:MAG TPA: twin-arginine translocase TatA/TatE family subunit [Acetobacteraceae bacterium]|nr:twin-arginine translocase TatA/TatE family subunit [Acetobacteraceae bacterium]
MGEFSIWHWMIVLLVVLLLFGSGKVSTLMGDVAKGIKSFKENMADAKPEPAPGATTDRPAGAIGAAGTTTASAGTVSAAPPVNAHQG